jgi:hypothetical protein
MRGTRSAESRTEIIPAPSLSPSPGPGFASPSRTRGFPFLCRLKTRPETVCAVDVRNGPADLLKDRLPGALQIPQNMI